MQHLWNPRKCCRQKTYGKAKFFRCNIYKKQGVPLFYPGAEPSQLLPFSLLPSFCERAWTKGHGVVYRSYVADSMRGASPLRGAT
jgi:hypothetical protein